MSTVSSLIDTNPDSVRFDFRFDPDLKEHEKKIAVRRELVYEFAASYVGAANRSLESVALYPVARAGKSGSEVFYLDLKISGHGPLVRFIAKFQSKKSTKEEAESAQLAVFAKLCSKVDAYLHASEDLGVIVYNLAASRDHIEFRGFFLDINNSDDKCATALRSVFQEVGREPDSDAKSRNLIDDFAEYVDRKSKPLQRIDALTIVASAQVGIGDIAASIQKTYKRIERDLNIEVHPYLVHGDLHARNLMLSKSNPAKTELIDFGWFHSGHPAKDFVLMECTLKYMLLPELLPIAKGASTDSLHIQAKCIEAFEQFLCKHGFDLPPVKDMVHAVFDGINVPAHQLKAISRVYVCLVEVRRAAGGVLQNYCDVYKPAMITPMQHYFASFFLVTVGLLGFSEIDQLWAMIGLQTVGANL